MHGVDAEVRRRDLGFCDRITGGIPDSGRCARRDLIQAVRAANHQRGDPALVQHRGYERRKPFIRAPGQ